MSNVTVSDVRDQSANGWTNLSDSKIQGYIDDAETKVNTLYSDRVARLPTLEGDEDLFVKYLAAHFCELAEGGESESESGQGGSVSYASGQREFGTNLSLTRYGQEAREMLRDEQGISIVRTGR